MAIVNLLAQLPKPGGLWPLIIEGIDKGVGNFGWTIVIFTLIVKLALTPLDFLMRWSGKKNALVQKKLAPQIEKINKKYANDKQMASVQTQALYKREGVHMIGSCLFSLVYLVLTMVVFFTLFGTLRDYSAYKVLNHYDSVKTEYYSVYESTEGTEEQKVVAAQKAVKVKWNQERDGWLWVSNIWRADSQENSIPSYSSLKSVVSSAKDKKATAAFKKIDKAEYNKVMGALIKEEKGNWNGYYILAILALGLTFTSQLISELGNKVKRTKQPKTNKFYKPLEDDKKKDPSNSKTMKILKYVMPVIMVIFVITSSAAFGIYIVVSSLISTLSNLLINYLVSLATKKQQAEVEAVLEKQERKQNKKLGVNK